METQRRKEWTKKSKQNRIIDIAEVIFNENGYDATTLDLIATHAGYTKRNLYQYFADKNDLFNAVTLKAISELNSRLTVIANMRGKGIDKFVEFVSAIFSFFHEHRRPFENIIFFDVSCCFNSVNHNDLHNAPEGFGKKARDLHEENMKLLLTILEEGVADKTITSDFTPKQLLLITWGQILGIVQSINKRFDVLASEFDTTSHDVFENYLKMIVNCLTR